MTTTELVTLIGLGLTFTIGIANLIITIRNAKKTTFINSITTSRIKYIQELRNTIAELCSLVTSYKLRISKLDYADHFELLKQTNKLKYLIRLYLNPADEYWDNQMLALTQQIVIKDDLDPQNKIEELIVITQFLLKLEWEGVKRESEKGIISDLEKREMYNKYVELHKNHIANQTTKK
jgi:hypothetical protein